MSIEHFLIRNINVFLFYWVLSLLTAIAYFIRMYIYKDRPLPTGFLWIGFPMRENKLVRLGLASCDNSNRSQPKWRLSFEVIPRRTIRIILPVPVQYFDQYDMVPRKTQVGRWIT